MNVPKDDFASQIPPQIPAAPGAEDAAAGSACILINPGSGEEDGHDLVEDIRRLAASHPGRVETRTLGKDQSLEDQIDAAVEDGFTTIVAGGGDGTISAVADRLAGTDRQLGILPLGTFNYVARRFELPEEMDEALSVALGAPAQAIDVGEVNGTVFLNNASLGLYPAILREREAVYRRWGRSQLAAYWSVVTTVLGFRKPMTLKVTAGGEVKRMKTPLVFVAANAFQLEEFELEGADEVRAGRLAAFVAPDCNRWELILFALKLMLRSSMPERDFALIAAEEIVVDCGRRRLLVARDGERDHMESPVTFRMNRGALRVRLPAGEPVPDP